MTRPMYVLLHYPNPKLRAARVEAREGKNPGGVRELLASPRWERRFFRFLDVGRIVEDGTDEDNARTARMDVWEERAPRGE